MMIYLAENLRAFRKCLDMTQEEVAEAVQVSPQSVSKWERGETCPDIELLPVLAALFGTTIDALMGMEKIHSEEIRNGVFQKAHLCFKQGYYGKAAEILTEGLKSFPNDDGMTAELAFSLSFDPGRLSDAVRLCGSVLNRKPTEKLRHTVRAVLCLVHLKAGQPDRARELAGTLPHMRESREAISGIINNDPRPEQLDEAIRLLVLGPV